MTRQLDNQRGRQSQLAEQLQISKSTITAWRQGAKPDFQMCLLVADHFKKDPLEIFDMVGDRNYRDIYIRFLQPARKAAARRKKNSRGKPQASEEDLYLKPEHADLHRELQALLESNTPEAWAIGTMIQAAVGHLPQRNPATSRKKAGKRAKPVKRRSAKAKP